MADISTHVRIFESDPDDDFVNKRAAAVKDIASRFTKKRDVPSILKSANELIASVEAKAAIAEPLSADVTASIIKAGATSFVADRNGMQILACAMLGCLQAIENSKPNAQVINVVDVLAIGVWSGLSYQAPRTDRKLEALRGELVKAAQVHTEQAAEAGRVRINIPDVGWTSPDTADPAKIGAAFQAGAKQTIEALRFNAILDREEIDYLWWVLGDRSGLLKQRFSQISNASAAAMASGLEAAFHLRRMPGEAHKHLALRHAIGSAPLTAADLVSALGEHRALLAANLTADQTLYACPHVFPVLTILVAGKTPGSGAKLKRPIEEWTARAFLEHAALRVTANYVTI